MEVIEESDMVVFLKMDSASRWRSGEDGAVNWKTAGADNATLDNESRQNMVPTIQVL